MYQPSQKLRSAFFLMHVLLQKEFTQIYRGLYTYTVLVSLSGVQMWQSKRNKISVMSYHTKGPFSKQNVKDKF